MLNFTHEMIVLAISKSSSNNYCAVSAEVAYLKYNYTILKPCNHITKRLKSDTFIKIELL